MIRDCPHRKKDLKWNIRKYVCEALQKEGQCSSRPSSQSKGGKKKLIHKLDSPPLETVEGEEEVSSASSMTESSKEEADLDSEQLENSDSKSRG
eukprot:1703159-Rhodomonas_salina.1